ncbi:hypothetical protein DU80_09005 [Methanosarcina mazei]|jgi:hypothetical protein|uniref:Uncharacterized protein n=1 Tax=Methanosarcina mazei TaxID=2209 RepID=A0A0F8GQT3_METMZ|nr:hypothetical protein DU40_00815 [Methanosarcina mazei]KKG02406.1 hypothetical protein DU31_04930 [Methanosarcina mazei]KKG02827.1 hypothetical protein DU47_00895 [Methanosarcina mazei]KKG14942.1 hypothetical protein DU34_04710 [Methanosarcina mazei]KKG34619.1 hypothetical protein DU49_19695 [Methanosarcina mazei]
MAQVLTDFWSFVEIESTRKKSPIPANIKYNPLTDKFIGVFMVVIIPPIMAKMEEKNKRRNILEFLFKTILI